MWYNTITTIETTNFRYKETAATIMSTVDAIEKGEKVLIILSSKKKIKGILELLSELTSSEIKVKKVYRYPDGYFKVKKKRKFMGIKVSRKKKVSGKH